MINPENTKMELSVRATRTFFRAFEKTYGKKELGHLIADTGMTLDYFEDENNWISYNYFCNLLDKIVDFSGDSETAYKYGLNASTSDSWGPILIIVKSFMSCAQAYKSIVSLSPRWAKSGEFLLLKLKKNNATIKYKLRKDLKQTINNCLSIQGQFASIPTIWNLPPAKIRELQCAAEGANSCIYEISWQNPPAKKTGLYLFLAGVIISVLIYLFGILEKSILPLFSWLTIIIAPIILFFIWKIINAKKILKENSTQKEEQNKALENNLVEMEKLNETLQEKVEEKTKELLKSNEELGKNINELKENEAELVRSEKMTTVGGIAVDYANKLKKPIDLIINNVHESIKKKPKKDPFYDDLVGAKKAVERCDNIVNELLSFSNNMDESYLEEVNINEIIENCIIKVSEEISNPNIKILKDLANSLPKIKADAGQMQQVFMVILTNAHDAILDKIKDKSEKDGEITIKSCIEENNILVEITDTGYGIPNNIINKIFDPFFSTKSTSKRKGMGLTLSYNIIKRIGGRIEATSIPGSGTTFSIYLPANS